MYLNELKPSTHVSLALQSLSSLLSFEARVLAVAERDKEELDVMFRNTPYCVVEDVLDDCTEYTHRSPGHVDVLFTNGNTLPHKWAKTKVSHFTTQSGRRVLVVSNGHSSERCNRRCAHRQPTALRASISVRGSQNFIVAIVKDLSAVGAGIRVPDYEADCVGKKCLLTIEMEDGSEVKIPARVVRSKASDAEHRVLGIKFKKYADVIANYINKKQRESILNAFAAA